MDRFAANGFELGLSPDKGEALKLSMRERNDLVYQELIVSLVYIGYVILLLNYIDYGDNFIYGILEVISSFLASMILMLLTIIVYALFVRIIRGIITLIGNGDIVIGIGFLFAGAGILIETYQVWQSSLWWSTMIIFGVFAFVVYINRDKKNI